MHIFCLDYQIIYKFNFEKNAFESLTMLLWRVECAQCSIAFRKFYSFQTGVRRNFEKDWFLVFSFFCAFKWRKLQYPVENSYRAVACLVFRNIRIAITEDYLFILLIFIYIIYIYTYIYITIFMIKKKECNFYI